MEIESESSKSSDLPSFLQNRVLKHTIKKKSQNTEVKQLSSLAVGQEYYSVLKNQNYLLIYDKNTGNLVDEVKHAQNGSAIKGNEIVIIGKIIYGYVYPDTFFSYKIGESETPRILKSGSARGSGWHGRTLRVGFFGEGIVCNQRNQDLTLFDLDGEGGVRRTILLKMPRLYSDSKEDEFNDFLVAGKDEEQIVAFFRRGTIIVNHFFLKRRKLLKRYTFKLSLLKDRDEQVFGCDLSPSDPQYMAVSTLRWNRKVSSRVVMLKLTNSQSIEQVASCDINFLGFGEMRVLRFFEKTFENSRYLLLFRITMKANSNRTLILYFDTQTSELCEVSEMELNLDVDRIYAATRAFGGIYCVDYTGAMSGFELTENEV